MAGYDGNPWDCWWNFNGTDTYLEMSHNADFSASSGEYASLVVGFRDLSTATSQHQTLIAKGQIGYTGATNGDFNLWLDRDPTSGRDAWWYYRLGSGANWSALGNTDDYHDGVDVCLSGTRSSPDKGQHTFMDDTEGCDSGNYKFTTVTTNYGGTSNLHIGCEKREDGVEPTYRYFFTGRIYFVYWIVHPTSRISDGWTPLILNGTLYPWNHATFDPDLYRTFLITFDQDVGSTYTPEIQSGPNAPYTLTVHGSPTKECSGFDAESILGHEFAVALSSQSVLGHDFAVELQTAKAIGHQFTVPSNRKLLSDISTITRKRLK